MIRSSAVKTTAMALVLGAGLVAIGCSRGARHAGPLGQVSLAFQLPSGASIDDVAYVIHAGAPGGVPDVTANACPYLTSWVASPLKVSIGGTIDVGAEAADLSSPPDTLTFAWAPAANFTAPTARTTQYHCTAPGTHTITVTVSDNHGAVPCTATVSLEVTCQTISECFNGVIDPGEECEPPNTATCDSTCHIIQSAGGTRDVTANGGTTTAS